jgi:hypothetical protein
MTSRTPRPLPDFGIEKGRIAPGQAFVAKEPLYALQCLDDSDALHLRRGAWIIAVPCERYCADARYVLASGEVVRLQFVGRGELLLTRGDGATEMITKAEADEMLVARVVMNAERR